MSKIAKTTYPIHDFLQKRWSPRAFAERPVEEEKLRSLLEAARWAASCFNEQPWHFIVATKDNPDAHERLFGCLNDKNQRWAGQAPVLMLSVAKLNFDHNDKPNPYAFHDVGLAMGDLITQASAMGLYVHQMAGFRRDQAREAYHIPEKYDPVAVIAIGYLGEPEKLPEALRDRETAPRQRKPLADFVFAGRWGQTADVLAGEE